ncbi:class I adenylate-forming enzyme family protein [Paenibacillus sp. Dod16]|uniref:class I adenylate-forming enzyme family protein n=1 Tax=Paenibacillus sp. Dod16 TaxID=3416392 RepID=UPI003CEB23A3
MTIVEEIQRAALNQPNKLAIIKDNDRLTYKELVQKSRDISQQIHGSTRVALCIKDPILFTINYLALLMANCSVVLFSANKPGEEIRQQMSFIRCPKIITDRSDLTGMDGVIHTGTFKQNHSIDLSSHMQDEHPYIYIQTSGSRSNPKVVKHSQYGLVWNAQAHNKFLQLDASHVALVILPLTSAFAHTTQFLSQLIIGGTLVFIQQPITAAAIYKKVFEHEVKSIGCVATHLHLFLSKPPESEVVQSLNYIITAGGPVPKSLVKKTQSLFPESTILRAYGLTESGPRVSCSSPSSTVKDDSSGVPLEGVNIKIKRSASALDEDVGEIWVKSPGNMIEYLYNKEETSRSLIDGWLKTGDIGTLDDSGKLYVKGRIKNIIICGGLTIYPEEIEEMMVAIDGVAECMAKGIEDNIYGEKLQIYIVTTNNDPAFVEIVLSKCEKFMRSWKIPFNIENALELPKTENGKIKRF